MSTTAATALDRIGAFSNAYTSEENTVFYAAILPEYAPQAGGMRLRQHAQLTLDPTIEYQRVGALKGIILNGDGSTLYNLFTEFGVTPPTEVGFDLANATPANGALRGDAQTEGNPRMLRDQHPGKQAVPIR